MRKLLTTSLIILGFAIATDGFANNGRKSANIKWPHSYGNKSKSKDSSPTMLEINIDHPSNLPGETYFGAAEYCNGKPSSGFITQVDLTYLSHVTVAYHKNCTLAIVVASAADDYLAHVCKTRAYTKEGDPIKSIQYHIEVNGDEVSCSIS